ncbi:hypothetical protein LUZ60_015884 [Juncus effusus]|nr:hypothetical protein LUZ60_015884 [Juncus effusus]
MWVPQLSVSCFLFITLHRNHASVRNLPFFSLSSLSNPIPKPSLDSHSHSHSLISPLIDSTIQYNTNSSSSMEEERFPRIPNPNPNPNPNAQNNKLTAPSILDRFQSMVRDRDGDLNSSEVVYFYQQLLRELTFNSKPIISELTMIAGDYKQFAEGIAGAICARVFEVSADQKLPSLYLLDSIVKNIGAEYIHHFTSRLAETFIGAYNRVHPSQHQAMRHLFRTWSQVFPSHVLRRIEDALQLAGATGASSERPESPRLSIHVNPKYLEGQFNKSNSVKHSKISNFEGERMEQLATESPSTWSSLSPTKLQYRGGDYSRRSEQLPPRAGSTAHQLDIPPAQHPQRKQPSMIIPQNSPTRIGIRRSRSPDLHPNGSNGFRIPNPRDLIDAYGGDNRERTSKIPRLEVNPREREWERGEEREYQWESMSPTLSDRNNRRDPREIVGLYGNGSGLVPNRVGLERERPAEPDLRRSWPGYDRPYGLDERRPVAETSAYHKYQTNMGSRAEPPLPYHINHTHEPSKHLPYTGSAMVQPNLGPPHHVRPVAQPSRVIPPLLSHPKMPVMTHPHHKPEYNAALDANKPSVFVPNWTPPVSGGQVHMPHLTQPPHQQAQVPPLPPGPPPPTGGAPVPTGGVQSAAPNAVVSGLLSTLMAQGLISLAAPPAQPSQPQDSGSLDFNPESLKIRHESAINSLYSELPRQCTTCGLRFRQQEEHSAHMDWHVTKNRVARNRKQKPSRKWFVSEKEWLSGAETLGTEVVPGFLPSEPVAEREKEEKETAVPADDDQTACALCGESFEDFYSDETEEWMYKGTVYMKEGTGMDNKIVHAKCLGTNFDG